LHLLHAVFYVNRVVIIRELCWCL